MEICNIIILIMQILLGILFILLFLNLLLSLQKKQTFLHYYLEFLKSDLHFSSRSLLISKENNKNIDKNVQNNEENSPSNPKFSFTNYIVLKFLNNFNYVFRLLKSDKGLSSFIITKEIALFILIFAYCLICEIVVICFQNDFFEESDCFRLVFLAIFLLSLFILLINTILVKFHNKTVLSAYFQKENNNISDFSEINFISFEFFLIFCNILHSVLFAISIYLLLFKRNLPYSILYFLPIAILLETCFFRPFLSLFLSILCFFAIKFQNKNISDLFHKEKLKEIQEKEMISLVLEFINPKNLIEDIENIKNEENSKIQMPFESPSNIFIKEELIHEKVQISDENTKNLNENIIEKNEKIQRVHRHNNKKSLVLAKRISTEKSESISKEFFFIKTESYTRSESYEENSKEKGNLEEKETFNESEEVFKDAFIQKISKNIIFSLKENIFRRKYEDEGNFHIFKRRLKDLKKKIMAIDLMICNYKGKNFNTVKKRVYLEGISNYLKDIATSIN